MSPLGLLIPMTILLVFVRAIDDEYDDYFLSNDTIPTIRSNDTNPSNDTNAIQSEQFSVIAARLNCSKLSIRHKGTKTEEIRSQSILKAIPRVAPKLVKRVKTEETVDESLFTLPDFLSNFFTLPPELFEKHENSAEGTLAPFTDFDYFTFATEELLNLTADDHQELNLTTAYQQKNDSMIPENVHSVVARKALINDSSELDNNFPNLDNISKPNDEKEIPECVYAFDNDGSSINWYEVIAQNGGLPGQVNATRLTPNITKVLEPCHRPVTNTSPPLQDLLYEYESIEYDKVYRHEKAFLRFAGTPSEFEDILGQLVWSPNEERRYYRLTYRKDDTGFYVYIRRRHKCVFEKNPLTVNCQRVADFAPCANMTDTRTLSPALQAGLIG